MDRLIDNDLIYGAMYEVSEPHMIARYNQALKGFGIKPTKLKKFTIDATGYSPEIAKQLKDEDYLNPQGINRRFIILSPEQESLPSVYAKFSSTYDLMMAMYQKNAESLRILTLKDVVFGEIENSTFHIDSIDDILSIKEVEFKFRTGGHLFEKAHKLKTLLNRFFTEKDSWQDDYLMNKILEYGKLVGDIRYNNIIPRFTNFELPSFWTSHFDGLYVFRENDGSSAGKITVIGPQEKPEFLENAMFDFNYIHQDDATGVYEFLIDTGRVSGFEPDWLKASGLVELRQEILVRSAINQSDKSMELHYLSDNQVTNWIHHNIDELSKNGVFTFLTRIQKGLLNGVLPNLKKVTASLKLLVVRANPDHQDRVLVARLLSQFADFDFFTKFAVNKQSFYDDYDGLDDNLRDYVVHKITNQYFPDRRGYWETLFSKPKG